MPEEELSKIKVRDIKHLIVQDPTVISQDCSIDDLLVKILEDPRSRHVYVVNKENSLVGSIRLNNIIRYLFTTTTLLENSVSFEINSFMAYSSAKKVKDIMNTVPSYVYEDMFLSEMIRIMTKEKVNELPIIDNNKKIIGEVNVIEIIDYYLKNKID